MKYIFVTGGVVSSLGKGLAAASLGTLLERRGLKVLLQKFDPYLNVDPGTMNPYQHGEVYVLNDGAETDLDLGHYERFTDCVLSRRNNLTSGQVYLNVIERERQGKYLGETIQVIPHITDEIKRRIHLLREEDADVIITEIGGTVGDIEGLSFLEAIRQFTQEIGPENVCLMHVTLVPYLRAAQEWKSKPTQQSVAKLREIGLQPNVILCRVEQGELENDLRQKIALFCNLSVRGVLECPDMKHNIYELPLALHREGLDNLVCEHLGLDTPAPDLEEWKAMLTRMIHPSNRVRIAVVGKYMGLRDAYKSIYESLFHAGAKHDAFIEYIDVDAELLINGEADRLLGAVDGILIPGGFGDRGTEGKIIAAQYARERKIPYFGLCLGLQIAVIEYARNVCGMEEANSTEFNENTPHPVVCILPEQRDKSEKGATMRLGSLRTALLKGTLAHRLYKNQDIISERHRHRYEVNPEYYERLEKAGLIISGANPDKRLIEIIELKDHPFYIAVQFHPEFSSKPTAPHPLFDGFVNAALEHQAQR